MSLLLLLETCLDQLGGGFGLILILFVVYTKLVCTFWSTILFKRSRRVTLLGRARSAVYICKSTVTYVITTDLYENHLVLSHPIVVTIIQLLSVVAGFENRDSPEDHGQHVKQHVSRFLEDLLGESLDLVRRPLFLVVIVFPGPRTTTLLKTRFVQRVEESKQPQKPNFR